MKRVFGGRLPLVLMLALPALLLIGSVDGGGKADAATGLPGWKYCGKFRAGQSHGGYKIRVYKRRMKCRKALRIQREYWTAPPRRKVVVGGGTGAFGYVLLKRFPGWKCTSGSGGGICRKGRGQALYQN